MEYNPNIFSLYEKPETIQTQGNAQVVSGKSLKQYGKFQRKKLMTGNTEQDNGLAVFLAASVIEMKHRRILKEAKGVDDVVKVSVSIPCIDACTYSLKQALVIYFCFCKLVT